MAAAAKPIYAAQAGTDYSIASLLINCPTRDVRFTPKSGHCIAPQRMSALCQKQTSGAQATRSGRLNISSKLCVRTAISIQSDEDNRRSAVVRIIESKAGNQQFPVRLNRDAPPAPLISRGSHEQQPAISERLIQSTARV